MKIETVLLVDDEEDIRTIARMSLEHVGGLRVSLASTGAEALDLAAANPPDLILLDMMMPGIDGLETFEQLRQGSKTSTIPVVFMTARVQPREVEDYLARGAVGVIKKPFDPMTLTEELHRILDGNS